MADVEVPSKVALDAATDQSLAWFREVRGGLTGVEGDVYRDLSGGMAAHMAAQFPGAAIGRTVMAVAQALKSIETALEEIGIESSPDVLLSIAGFAAEQLERGTS